MSRACFFDATQERLPAKTSLQCPGKPHSVEEASQANNNCLFL